MSWLEDIILAQARAGALPGMFNPGDVMPLGTMETARRYMGTAPVVPPSLSPEIPGDPNAGLYPPLEGQPGMPQLSEGRRGSFASGSMLDTLLPREAEAPGLGRLMIPQLGALSGLFAPAAAAPVEKPATTEEPPGRDPISMPPKTVTFGEGAEPFSGPIGWQEPAPEKAGAPLSLDPKDNDDRLPPNATPTTDIPRERGTPAPSFFDGMLSRLNDNRGTLLALAGGFAGAPSFGQGMRRAFSAAAPVAQADRAYSQSQTGVAATYRAVYDQMIANGETPEKARATALAASQNPKLLDKLAPSLFETAKPEWKQIDTDFAGNAVFGLVNTQKGTVNGRPIGGSQDGAAGGGYGGGNSAFLAKGVAKVDSELTGDEYLNQFSPEIRAGVKSYLEGRSLTTGNPRKGETALVKRIAQKYGPEVGMEADDITVAGRRTLLNDLNRTTPGTAGGQITSARTSLNHLGEVAKAAVALKNSDGFGIAPLGQLINSIGSLGTGQAAKIAKLNTEAQHYGQEVTKFYAGSQGGVQERDRFLHSLSGVKTSQELAAVLEGELALIPGRLNELKNRIATTFGPNGEKKYPTESAETQEARHIIEGAIKELRGEKPAGAVSAPSAAAPRLKPGEATTINGVVIRRLN